MKLPRLYAHDACLNLWAVVLFRFNVRDVPQSRLELCASGARGSFLEILEASELFGEPGGEKLFEREMLSGGELLRSFQKFLRQYDASGHQTRRTLIPASLNNVSVRPKC